MSKSLDKFISQLQSRKADIINTLREVFTRFYNRFNQLIGLSGQETFLDALLITIKKVSIAMDYFITQVLNGFTIIKNLFTEIYNLAGRIYEMFKGKSIVEGFMTLGSTDLSTLLGEKKERVVGTMSHNEALEKYAEYFKAGRMDKIASAITDDIEKQKLIQKRLYDWTKNNTYIRDLFLEAVTERFIYKDSIGERIFSGMQDFSSKVDFKKFDNSSLEKLLGTSIEPTINVEPIKSTTRQVKLAWFEAFDDIQKKVEDVFSNIKTTVQWLAQTLFSTLSEAFSSFFIDAIEGDLKQFKEYFISFMKGIAKALSDILAQKMALSLLAGIGNMLPMGSATFANVKGGGISSQGTQLTGTPMTNPLMKASPNVQIVNNSGLPMAGNAQYAQDDMGNTIVTVFLDRLNRDGNLRKAIAGAR